MENREEQTRFQIPVGSAQVDSIAQIATVVRRPDLRWPAPHAKLRSLQKKACLTPVFERLALVRECCGLGPDQATSRYALDPHCSLTNWPIR